MFEHVRNYEQLLERIASWLRVEGKLFIHIFCHRRYAYLFEIDGANNWMGRHFFTGGIMPSEKLFHYFQRDLSILQQWWIPGENYAKTCEAWLAKLDASHEQAKQTLAGGSNPLPPQIQLQRWRIFFMACAELFAFDEGNQWGVAHYLFQSK